MTLEKPLFARGQKPEISGRKKAGNVGILPEELNTVADPARGRELLKLGADTMIAPGDQNAPGAGKLLLEMRQSPDQLAMSLCSE